MSSHRKIGNRFLESGRITSEQLQRALAHQQLSGGRLGDALVSLGFLPESAVLAELARQRGVAWVQIGERYVPAEIVRLLPPKYIRARRVFPFALGPDERRGRIFVATTEPQNLTVVDEIAFTTGMTVQLVLTSDGDLDAAIERHLGRADAGTSGSQRDQRLPQSNP